jgi:uncharacterized protein (TIGR03435 family)
MAYRLFLNRYRTIFFTCVTVILPAFGQGTPPPPPLHGPSPQDLPTTVDPSVHPPDFDVISVKVNKSGGGIRIMNTPDGFLATNVPLKFVIGSAYAVRDDLISGVSGWADSGRYDITAKVAAADVPTLKKLTAGQRAAMLQPLLTDRFKLKAHYETKTLPVYELVLSNRGSKLHQAVPGDTYPNGIKGPDGSGARGMMMMSGKITAQAVPIASLINVLSRQLQRTVVDKTGLTGKYDFILQWAPEQGEGTVLAAGLDAKTPQPASDSSGPSIFTALEEQLGLKLVPAMGPVKIVIVDHIEKPSEN